MDEVKAARRVVWSPGAYYSRGPDWASSFGFGPQPSCGTAVKKEDVWSVEDGVLVCKGQPFGYLFTEDSYQDFTLTFEWRWPEGKEPGNSGVLLRIAGEPNGFMPKCVEAQLKNGSAGDIWAFFGAKVEGDEDRMVEVKDHKDLKDFIGVKA